MSATGSLNGDCGLPGEGLVGLQVPMADAVAGVVLDALAVVGRHNAGQVAYTRKLDSSLLFQVEGLRDGGMEGRRAVGAVDIAAVMVLVSGRFSGTFVPIGRARLQPGDASLWTKPRSWRVSADSLGARYLELTY